MFINCQYRRITSCIRRTSLIESQRGQIAIGWLIVEDLAMVLTLVLLPAAAAIMNTDDASFSELALGLAWTIGKVVLFIFIMIVVGRKVIPWILSRTASTGSRELFTLAVLALALGIAYAAVAIFDASFALGAFFAGMVLNESELSHRAAQDTLPLRDAFAVLFFVSVGMLFDPVVLIEQPLGILAVLAIIIIGKSAAALVLVRMFGHSRRTALTISVSLAQIGEFAFILAGMGLTLGVMDKDAQNLVLAGAIVSIMLNPVLFSLLDKYLEKTETIEEQLLEETLEEETQVPVDICGHAIIVGYGRVGGMLADKLRRREIPVVVVEDTRSRFEELAENGFSAILGNGANREIISLARIECAKTLLLTIPNGYEAGEIVATAKEMNPDVTVIVRAHYDDEVSFIKERGADHIIIGEHEIAKSMATLMCNDVEEFGCSIDDMIDSDNDKKGEGKSLDDYLKPAH